MDARAYRLPWPQGTTVFEVDRPEVLAYKERVLTGLAAAPKAMRRTVAIDLRDDFAAALRAAGFAPKDKTAFLVEGLLVYLPDEAAALRILREVAGMAAPGSFLALDLSGLSFLQSPFLKAMCDLLATQKAPWQFGTDEPEAFLARAGFTQVKVVEPGEVGHGRWPYPTAPRSVPGVPRTYLVTARKG
jgi:methyltransferase (TIGR00027 family)